MSDSINKKKYKSLDIKLDTVRHCDKNEKRSDIAIAYGYNEVTLSVIMTMIFFRFLIRIKFAINKVFWTFPRT